MLLFNKLFYEENWVEVVIDLWYNLKIEIKYEPNIKNCEQLAISFLIMQRTSPPFRADINGSFLRPQCVIDARVQYEEGEISASDKISIEQREIAKLVQKEESIGLQVVTDGEYPREFYHLDFLVALTGVQKFRGQHGFRFKGGVETKP